MQDKRLHITRRQWSLPKQGNALDEYEDYCRSDLQRLRFAIADGAAESSFADLWAKLLVHSFLKAPDPLLAGQWHEWLAPLQVAWRKKVDGQERSWYAEAKAARGAFAAFLGLTLSLDRRWQAVAVGDCCLVQVRQGTLHTKFPLSASSEFSSRPFLIGSRSPLDEITDMKLDRRADGDWQFGDRFLLMTDALSEWYLRQVESGQDPTVLADHLVASSQEEFASRIETLRRDQGLNNDDVTLFQVTLQAAEESAQKVP